jgi:hypothetical protein
MEKPVVHLLSALSSLTFHHQFYPPLDIRRLYKILTTESTMAMANPALMGLMGAGNRICILCR